jgi:hypothetical protein
MARRPDGVDRHLDVAVGAVLEADGHRQARRQLPMDLALDRAGADGAPAHHVGVVLAQRGVEELRRYRKPGRRDVGHQPPGDPQALSDMEGSVEVRVVDQALPADHRPRLLEIHPHGHDELARMAIRGAAQERGIFDRGSRVVDRAGPGDHEQAVIPAGHDRCNLRASARDPGRARVVQRDFLLQRRGRRKGPRRADAEVGRGLVHSGGPVAALRRRRACAR